MKRLHKHLLLLLLFPATVLSQTNAGRTDTTKTKTLHTVTVIGSRNATRTKIQTAVPVDIISVSTMSKSIGQTDLNQLLTYAAPSFQSSRQTVADGTDHVDPAQLRGMGTDQVLVLVNGKRRHSSALVNVNGTVNRGQVGTDLNAIPVAAIDHVEILRDGAAAQYGSDAIAGVINIVLKQNTHLLTGNVSYGENVTRYDKGYGLAKSDKSGYVNVRDGGIFQADVNYGFDLGKKGYLNLTGAYSSREASNRTGTYTGPVYPNVNGVNRDDSILAARALNRNDFDMRIGNSKMTNAGFIFNGGYDLGEHWQLKLFGGFSQKNGEAAGFFRYPSSIPAAADIYAAKAFEKYPDGFLPLIKTNIKDYYVSAGVEGEWKTWNLSLSNTTGINEFDFSVDHSINYTQFAVTPDPQTKFDAGGLKFVQNTINLDVNRNFPILAGLNIAYGAEFRIEQYTQRAGEEASYKNFNTNSKAAAGAQVFAGFIPAYAESHSRNNVGLYLDVEQDFTKRWMLEGAIRYENYNDFGSTFNYKVATRYQLTDWLFFRGAVSSGFRAPSLQQKFYAKTNTLFVSGPNGLTPTESGTFTNDSKPAEILGIPTLTEETSQNYSAGFSASPLQGLQITVDAYAININNRIILTNNFTGGTDPVLTQLLKDNGASTANFFSNAVDTRSKGLEAVVNYNHNLSNTDHVELILAATFIKNEVKKGANGQPIVNASQRLINSGQLGNYFNREDQSRIEVVNPESKASLTMMYTHKRISAMLRFVYFGRVTYLDPTINPDSTQKFPVNTFTGQKQTLDQEFSPKTITDISLSYNVTNNITVTAGASNLFDVYQDKQTHSGNVSLGRFIYSRRVEQMGFNGRYIFGRVSFNVNTKNTGRFKINGQ